MRKFGKLLPRDRTEIEEDERLELVNRGGNVRFQPTSEKDKRRITSLYLWDLAFMVYMKMYIEKFAYQSTKLLEYSHNIYAMSDTYIWSKVYKYDKKFRYHMEKHSECNWGVIFHQAWPLYLNEKVYVSHQNELKYQKTDSRTEASQSNSVKKNKICYKYNGRKCTCRFGCKFIHKCVVCNKFGHGTRICRKAMNTENQGGVTLKGRESGDDESRERRGCH